MLYVALVLNTLMLAAALFALIASGHLTLLAPAVFFFGFLWFLTLARIHTARSQKKNKK